MIELKNAVNEAKIKLGLSNSELSKLIGHSRNYISETLRIGVMNHNNERKAFEGYYIANYHDGDIHPHKKLLEWCEDGESYINSTIDNLWDMWLASANREGYKLVPVDTHYKLDNDGNVFTKP